MYQSGFRAALVGSALSAALVFAPSTWASEPDRGRPDSWTGLYLGLQGGVAWGDTDWAGPPAFFGVTNFSTSPEGGLFGGHLGYNVQSGRWVFGVEVSYSGATLRDTVVGPVPVFPNDSFQTEIHDLFTATARVGYASGNTLLYARGGYANGEVALSGLSGAPVAGVTFDVSDRLGGWTVGAGLEYKLHRNIVLGVEYNYVNLDGGTFNTVTGGAVPGIPVSVNLGDVDVHSVGARLSILLQ